MASSGLLTAGLVSVFHSQAGGYVHTLSQPLCLFPVFPGSALQFAVQTAISQASGGRAGVPKAVVMLVTERSTDNVQKAANDALVAGKAL